MKIKAGGNWFRRKNFNKNFRMEIDSRLKLSEFEFIRDCVFEYTQIFLKLAAQFFLYKSFVLLSFVDTWVELNKHLLFFLTTFQLLPENFTSLVFFLPLFTFLFQLWAPKCLDRIHLSFQFTFLNQNFISQQ